LKSRAQHIVRLDDVEVYSGRKRRRELDGGCEITLSAELNISNRRVLGCPWLPKCAGEIRQPCRIDGAGHDRVAVEERYLASGNLADFPGRALIDLIPDCHHAENAVLVGSAEVDRLEKYLVKVPCQKPPLLVGRQANGPGKRVLC